MQLGNSRPGQQRLLAEEALVRRASAGDAEAFADLYESYLDRVFRYFYYRVGNRQDAEDLTEQVFLRAWQAIGRYDCRGTPFSAWVFRIAHNLLVDYRRASVEYTQLDEALRVEDDSVGPDELALRRAEAYALAKALGQLSPLEQTVVALRFVEGLDHRTVAGIVDKSETATRSIQSRALARLARVLEVEKRSVR